LRVERSLSQIEVSAGASRSVARPRSASHMRLMIAKALCARELRPIWLAAAAVSSVSRADRQLLSNRPPCRNDSGYFLGFPSPLLSSFEPSPGPSPGMDHTCQGFLPLRGSQKRPLHTGVPRPATFRPQTFSVSRRFAPLLASQAYFIPQPRPGFACPGVSPLRAGLLSHRKQLPPCC
jgi:hypothetical protein